MRRHLTRMALALAVAATAGCAKKAAVPGDEPMRLALDAAATELSAGRYEAAAAEYRRALDRAYVRDDRGAAAAFRYQLGVCALGLGRAEAARAAFAAAALEAQAAGRSPLAARAEAAEARVVLESGQAAEAGRLAERALGRLPEGKEARLRADLRLVLAEAAVLAGVPAEGRRELDAARKAWGSMKAEPVFEAVAARTLGRILTAEAKPAAEAAAAFDAEALRWQEAGRYAERAAALARAAAGWEKAERFDLAARRGLAAARIWRGLGAADKAAALGGKAAEWAAKAGLAEVAALARLAQNPLP